MATLKSYLHDLPNDVIKYLQMRHLFSRAFSKDQSQSDLSNDLSTISQWTFQWKMQFNLVENCSLI